jgi:hypothetical protein
MIFDGSADAAGMLTFWPRETSMNDAQIRPVISPQMRRQSTFLNLIAAILGILPVIVGLVRDDLFFLAAYTAVYSLAFAFGAVIWFRANRPRFVVKGTSLHRMNKLMWAIVIAGNLYTLGVTTLLSRPFAGVGHMLATVLAGAITCAVSGIVGNFACDYVKHKFGLFSGNAR